MSVEISPDLCLLDGFLFSKKTRQVLDPESTLALDTFGLRPVLDLYYSRLLQIHDAFDFPGRVYVAVCPLLSAELNLDIIPVVDSATFYIQNREPTATDFTFKFYQESPFASTTTTTTDSITSSSMSSSSSTISQASSTSSALPTSAEDLSHYCWQFHKTNHKLHMRILQHRSMADLIDHLQSSMTATFPYIDYPRTEVLKLILTASAISDPALTSDTKLPTPAVAYAIDTPLHIRAADYLQRLLTVAMSSEEVADSEDGAQSSPQTKTLEMEKKELCRILRDTFSFLAASSVKRGHRNASRSASASASRANSIAASRETSPGGLRSRSRSKLMLHPSYVSESTWLSRKTLFGNSTFENLGRDPWDYFLWGFRCALQGLTKDDEVSRVSWNVWQSVLGLIIQFYMLEWQVLDGDGSQTFSEYQLVDNRSFFIENICSLGRGSLEQGLVELVSIALVKDVSTLENVSPIMESDMLLTDQAHRLVALSNPIEKHSELGTESIPLRRSLILLGRRFLLLLDKRSQSHILSVYMTHVIKRLLKLKRSDLRRFFSTDIHYTDDEEHKFMVKLAQWAIRSLTGLAINKHIIGSNPVEMLALRMLEADKTELEDPRVPILAQFLFQGFSPELTKRILVKFPILDDELDAPEVIELN